MLKRLAKVFFLVTAGLFSAGASWSQPGQNGEIAAGVATDPSGVKDSTRAIQSMINRSGTECMAQNGVEVRLPAGRFRISAPLDTTGHCGVRIVGAGPHATVIAAMGNFPAFIDQGTHGKVDNKVEISNLWVQCSGERNNQASGVKWTYVNSGRISNTFFTGCAKGLELYDQWETALSDIWMFGSGQQQNGICLYQGAPSDPADQMPNNAVQAVNIFCENPASYGFRLVYFAGSKYVNVEASRARVTFYLCDAAYGRADIPCQFGHFSNVLADSSTGKGFYINQGPNKNPVTDLMFDNVWSGNTHDAAFLCGGCTNVTIGNLHIASADFGLVLKNSNHVMATAHVHNYNRRNNGSAAVLLDGTHNSVVRAEDNSAKYDVAYNGFKEANGSSGNQIWGGVADCGIGSSGMDNRPHSCRYQIEGARVDVQYSFWLKSAVVGSIILTGLPMAAASGPGAMASVSADGGPNSARAMLMVQIAPGADDVKLDTITPVDYAKSGIQLMGTLSYFKN